MTVRISFTWFFSHFVVPTISFKNLRVFPSEKLPSFHWLFTIVGIQRWLLVNCKLCKNGICFHLDPKEEKEEENDSTLPQEVSIAATRPSRGWRSSSRTSIHRHRDTENTRSSRSKTGSLQLICKSEPNTDQLDYGTVQVEHDYLGTSCLLIFIVLLNIYQNSVTFRGGCSVIQEGFLFDNLQIFSFRVITSESNLVWVSWL